MNYLNKQQKIAYSKVFYDLHDTFSRDIVIYKRPNTILISSKPEYNFLYSQQQDGLEVQNDMVSGVFPARIKWESAANKTNDIKEIKPEILGNYCRLKVKANVLEFLGDAGGQRIEVDGRPVVWVGSSQIHGLFYQDFYNMYLMEVD